GVLGARRAGTAPAVSAPNQWLSRPTLLGKQRRTRSPGRTPSASHSRAIPSKEGAPQEGVPSTETSRVVSRNVRICCVRNGVFIFFGSRLRGDGCQPPRLVFIQWPGVPESAVA